MPSKPVALTDSSFSHKARNMFSRSPSLSKTPSITRRFLSGSRDLGNETSLALKYQYEADRLHERGDWEGAIDKYQQCTKYAPENGYLWTSMQVLPSSWLWLRATYTCSGEPPGVSPWAALVLTFRFLRYNDAITSARKAININSLNAKAWSQVAEAYGRLEQWNSAFEAYDHAISLLKSQQPPDDKLRGEVQLSYSEAKKRAKHRGEDASRQLVSAPTGQQSWELAASIAAQFKSLPRSQQEETSTSAYVILEAHEEFKKGYSLIQEIKEVPLPGGGTGISGNPQAIAYMTNGIVRDDRCFYMEDSETFLRQLAAQAQFEIIRSDAWDLSATDETVIREAKGRQVARGWDDVRPALSTTVRVWILNAHISQGLAQYGQAVGLYKRALAVLDWGRKEWADANRKERGAIFDSTFVRGVRVLYVQTLVKAYEQTMSDKSHPYNLREIMEVADRIQADCRDRPVKKILSSGKPASIVFIQSYQRYPEGKARLCKAYYYLQQGRRAILDGGDRADAYRDLRLSANEYRNAKEYFPRDDEYYSICLANALEALFMSKTPLVETSAIITELRSAWAVSLKIWGQSSYATGGGRAKIERLFQFQDNALKAVADGAGAIGDRIVPGRLGNRIL
ncbi:uncharacterized protein EI90DRAFT_3122362 [Cantharellus anzutake]|uniref:uncharacterized protein n=1 Tax=Cantharellus anzutake TaxID=1750568 RepID=UPI001905A486|nr:uncharacterized protein EI90DRAFT_3122362 [Cantharellus anzutake]KAF8332610.1 hypothetical protein EI90DRAFT_3122362 [Cantharellus anzutake]